MTAHVAEHPRSRTGPRGDSPPRARLAALLLPDEARARYRLYALVAVALWFVALGLVLVRAHVKRTNVDFAVGDAVGYYAYLPSLVIDGDLDFRNQLLTQWHGDVPPDFRDKTDGYAVGAGKNRWPIGAALTVAPAFLVAHGLSHALHATTGAAAFEPNGYTILYMIFTATSAMALCAGGMVAADRLVTQRFAVPGRCAAAAVLTFWVGTHYLWQYVREPLLAHAVGAAWIALAVYLAHRTDVETREGGLTWWRLPLLALATSMALVCRYTNAFIVPVLLYVLITLARRGMFARAARQAPLILLALAPLLAQAWLMHHMTGGVVHDTVQEVGYERRERFYWTDPALVLSLVSSRRGLFFWTPVLIFSAWGLARHVIGRRGWRDPLLASLIVSATILWYVNSSWYAWWMGNGLGNRAYVELAALFIVGFGFAYAWLEQARDWPRRAALALLLLGATVNFTLMGLKLTDRLDGHGPLLAWEKRIFTGRWQRF